MKRIKRDIALLEKLLRGYGDVRLSEALGILKNSHPGAPRKWNLDKRVNLYLDVQVEIAAGKTARAACSKVADRDGFALKTIEKYYHAAKADFERIVAPHKREILADHIASKNGAK